MRLLRKFRLRATWLFRRSRIETDLNDEIQDYVEQQTELYCAHGLSPEKARLQALRDVGGIEKVKEECREARGTAWFENAFQDIRFGLRLLGKNPGFTVVAVLTLALGIGANTAIFTVVNAVLLRPLPFPEPERLVQLWESKPEKEYFRNVVNPINFLEWSSRTHSFDGMSAASAETANLTGIGDPIAVPAMVVSPTFFSVLGISPVLGRSFLAQEGVPGQDRVAVLSFRLWQSRFGGDSGILGRKIVIDGEPHTVVGVMPPGFALPKHQADLWKPLPIVRSPKKKAEDFCR